MSADDLVLVGVSLVWLLVGLWLGTRHGMRFERRRSDRRAAAAYDRGYRRGLGFQAQLTDDDVVDLREEVGPP